MEEVSTFSKEELKVELEVKDGLKVEVKVEGVFKLEISELDEEVTDVVSVEDEPNREDVEGIDDDCTSNVRLEDAVEDEILDESNKLSDVEVTTETESEVDITKEVVREVGDNCDKDVVVKVAVGVVVAILVAILTVNDSVVDRVILVAPVKVSVVEVSAADEVDINVSMLVLKLEVEVSVEVNVDVGTVAELDAAVEVKLEDIVAVFAVPVSLKDVLVGTVKNVVAREVDITEIISSIVEDSDDNVDEIIERVADVVVSSVLKLAADTVVVVSLNEVDKVADGETEDTSPKDAVVV